jgi:hypothetical protein
MKRKDYTEVSPEPKDYGDSDYSDDRSSSSWAAAERDDNDLYIWEEVPKEKTPEGPNDGGNDNGGDNNDGDDSGDNGGDPGDDDPFGMHLMCCAACRHSISELYASVDECFQPMEAMRQRMGGFGTRGRRRLQVPKSQRVKTFWHGWEHEGQVVQ